MPTALELSQEEWDRYVRAASRRAAPAEPSAKEQAERERLLQLARKAANVLKTQFGVQRVLVFGSLAHSAWFVSDSDVDLAVEGLPGEKYWAAWNLVEDIIGDRQVDLIDIETASDSLRHAIERHGIEL